MGIIQVDPSERVVEIIDRRREIVGHHESLVSRGSSDGGPREISKGPVHAELNLVSIKDETASERMHDTSLRGSEGS